MRRKHIYVGMDVHKETTVVTLAHGGRGGRVERPSDTRGPKGSLEKWLG